MHWSIRFRKQGEHMIYADVQHGKVSDFIITLMTQTKAKKIRAGFIKKDGSYRVGKFDLKHRKTWKQLDGTMYKRKGKKRTTNPDENILVHDLVKKAPRNIPVSRLLWFSVGRKIYKVQKLEDNHSRRIFMFERVKFNHLKLLMSSKEMNNKYGLKLLN
jgi:hypothetical protein